jgi:hypothetical protein
MFHIKIKRSPCPQTSEEVELKFRCGRTNRYYAELTNLRTITHTYYTKYTNLGVAEARACQIAGSITASDGSERTNGDATHTQKKIIAGAQYRSD